MKEHLSRSPNNAQQAWETRRIAAKLLDQSGHRSSIPLGRKLGEILNRQLRKRYFRFGPFCKICARAFEPPTTGPLTGHCDECYGPSVLRANRILKYGISNSEFQRMEERCGGLCEVCRKPPPKGRPLNIDHDHRTGAVRGLVCTKCNWGLSLLDSDPNWVTNAQAYLVRQS